MKTIHIKFILSISTGLFTRNQNKKIKSIFVWNACKVSVV